MIDLKHHFAGKTTLLDQTLKSVTTAAVNLMDGVDYADVMLIDGDDFRSVAPTASMLAKLDAVQMQLHQGPCLEAATADTVIRSPELKTDARWPGYAAAAIEAGVHGMLSFQLFNHGKSAGALNLFCRNGGRLSIETEAIGAMLATHAAIVLMADGDRQHFESALASRDVIGQAKGVIMERFKLDAVHAFQLLAKLSQDSNVPVTIIAQNLIETLSVATPDPVL